MRSIYIARDHKRVGLLKNKYRKVRRNLFLSDQDGFFEAGLDKISTDVSDYEKLSQHDIRWGRYDAVVVNMKAYNVQGDNELMARLYREHLADIDIKKVFFIGSAKADYMVPDAVLDTFDVVFKREPFRDRDRYDISEANKAKIRPTMISCPFVHAPRDNWLSKAYHFVRPKVPVCEVGEAVYDVGFSGADAAEHSLRRDVWQRVVDEGFSHIGGLQPNPSTKTPVPEALRGPRFKGKAYRDALCQAKINLALDGIGQYTFRHQELLYLGAFMMSGPSIRELELPMPLKENEHYVAFDNLDDMVEKIRYYLAHEDERQNIAAAGKRLFDEYYNPVWHGQEIVAAIEAVR